MEKKRMKKLAGINEGTIFKNGKFKLERFNTWETWDREAYPTDGEWCESDAVAELEAIANQMYDMLSTFDTPATKMLLKKAKSL